MAKFDVAVIGAGAAGMMCAATAAQRGLRVVLIDHAAKLAEKIRISGGGRCNFTNINAGPANFLSENPHFCKSACRATRRGLPRAGEKAPHRLPREHKGQLFCDDSAEQIIDAQGRMRRRRRALAHAVQGEALEQAAEGFVLQTDQGVIEADSVVIATGGLSIPKIGATDFGYRIAKAVRPAHGRPRPALVPLTFDAEAGRRSWKWPASRWKWTWKPAR
jgi:predicted Rossmann fold flavoprotein